MILKTGVNRATQNTTLNRNSIQGTTQSLQSQILGVGSQLVIARVSDIVLDENHSKFDKVGRENGIGAIFFEIVNNTGTNNINSENVIFALPLFSNVKIYPLINELVVLINCPNQQMGTLSTTTSYYYLPSLGVWNHPHHNAYPNLLFTNLLPPSQQQDYVSTISGSVRRVQDGSTEINLNSPTNTSQNTFVEKTDIHPIIPFMGDVIHEGRHGQSIRFGSTAKTTSLNKNNWSTSGENGNPITILRNGQPEDASKTPGYLPIVEDINKDLSSIYLTSTQKIPLVLSSNNFNSFKNKPTLPSQYISSQIFANSDSIVIQSKKDNIFLNSKSSISLSSVNSVNVDSPSTILQSTNIFLGDKDAIERGVKGDTLYNKLDVILTSLITLVRVLEVQQLWPGGLPSPDGGTMTISSNVRQQLTETQKTLKQILSEVVKTV